MVRSGSARSPAAQRLRASLQRHRAQEPDDPEEVIGVEVGEEDVADVERDAVAHHLPLRPFAAVEEQRLPLTDEGKGRDPAFDGGAGGGGSEESEGEGHGAGNIAAEAAVARESDDRVRGPNRRDVRPASVI